MRSSTKKREAILINDAIKTYDKDAILIYGDGSINPNMMKFISTPNVRLKTLLEQHFKH